VAERAWCLQGFTLSFGALFIGVHILLATAAALPCCPL